MEDKEKLQQGWRQNYRELEDYYKEALNTYWRDLKKSLKESERDWAKASDLRDVVDNQKNPFKSAYDAFVETYEPLRSKPAIALYEIDMENLDLYEETLGLDRPGREIQD